IERLVPIAGLDAHAMRAAREALDARRHRPAIAAVDRHARVRRRARADDQVTAADDRDLRRRSGGRRRAAGLQRDEDEPLSSCVDMVAYEDRIIAGSQNLDGLLTRSQVAHKAWNHVAFLLAVDEDLGLRDRRAFAGGERDAEPSVARHEEQDAQDDAQYERD